MQSSLYSVGLPVAALVVSVGGALLIHRRDRVSYRTMFLDVLCYAAGGVLFWMSLEAIAGIWLSRSLEQSLREVYLGWVGFVPVPVWCFLALLGAFIFGARWRYHIRHRAPINPLERTRASARRSA